MYARVVTTRFDATKFDEFQHLVHEQLAPAIRELLGCQGYHPGVERESGRFIGFSLWDTEEQALAANEVGSALGARPQFQALGVEPGTTVIYEVIA